MGEKINLDHKYVPADEVVAREIEGELILVPLTSGIGDLEEELFSLNAAGKAIFNKLDGRKNLRTVIEELSRDFEADPVEIEEDVLGLMEELLKRRIVVDASKG